MYIHVHYTCAYTLCAPVYYAYLRLAVLLQPADNAAGESVKASHTDAGVKRLEQLISNTLKLKGDSE